MILYLAGSESHTKRLIDAGATHLLYSYEYMRKKGVEDFADYYRPLRGVDNVKIMIDSGGFTINRNASEWPLEKCIPFRDEYITWLIKNKDSIDVAAELDLTSVLTPEQLEDWRDNYFAKLTKDHGVNICYIWHNGEKQSEWIAMCKKYDYVGLAGARKWDTAKLSSYCRAARKHKARVHAFGFTRPEPLVKMRPYSADSSSWINGMKYGTTFILDKNAFRVYDLHNKDVRNRYKRKYIKQGLNWSLIKKDDPNETTKASIMEWVLLEKWINKRIKLRKEKSAIAKPDVAKGAALSKTDSSFKDMVSIQETTQSLIRMPDAAQLACVNCHIGEECDRYNEKSTKCNYPLEPFPGDIESNDPLVRVQLTILKTDWDVWQRNIQFQQQQGGYTDRSIAAQGTQLFNSINALRDSLKVRGAGGGMTPDQPLTNNAKSAMGNIFASLGKMLTDESEPKPVVTIEHPEFQDTLKPVSPVEAHNNELAIQHNKREAHE